MMGSLTRRCGKTVVLSRCIIEHYIGNEGFVESWRHRLRWARSTRRSRRIGYPGELFTQTTALALLLWIVDPCAWKFALLALIFRAAAQWSTGIRVLDDPLVKKYWWLLPFEDLVSPLIWLLGFFGNTITWRGRTLVLAPDGTFDMNQVSGSEQGL